MNQGKCYQCGKYFTTDGKYDEWYSIHKHPDIHSWILCSPSCLVELAWEMKEGQEKLSKSKESKEG